MRMNGGVKRQCDRTLGGLRRGQPWSFKSLSADFNPNALKDTYDHSCFLARSNKYRHLMTLTPSARRGRRGAAAARAHAPAGAAPRAGRVISDCHVSVHLNHFIPGFLSYSVAVFRKWQSDITLRAGHRLGGRGHRGLPAPPRRRRRAPPPRGARPGLGGRRRLRRGSSVIIPSHYYRITV
jgi:hypothetical protein